MKNFLTLLLIAVLCLSLVACNTENDSDHSSSQSKTNEENSATQPQDRVLTWDELKSAVTIVDLTMDNWEEYFEICEVEKIEPADVEDEEPDVKCDLYVKLKAENTYAADIVMRFSYQQAITNHQFDASTKTQTSSDIGSYRSGEDTLKDDALSYQGYLGTLGSLGTGTYHRYQYNGVIYETILDVKDIVCTNVQGKILLLNLPADAWSNTRYGGRSLYILYEKDGQKYTIMKDGMDSELRKLFITES